MHSVKLWSFCVLDIGVNLLVGTESGLMLLDRSGQGKVYPLINRRRFQQMDVLEGLNVLVTISGKCGFGRAGHQDCLKVQCFPRWNLSELVFGSDSSEIKPWRDFTIM